MIAEIEAHVRNTGAAICRTLRRPCGMGQQFATLHLQ